MQLSRKQVVLISIVSGLILLLTLGAVLILTSSEGEAALEPTASPLPTALPATPTPTAAPSPTVFRLPLVPQWDTPRPTAEPSAVTGAFVPRTTQPPDTGEPQGTAGPWVGAWDEHTKDVLAVGLLEGRAAALLLARLTEDGLALAALPAGDRLLAGADPAEQGAQAAALVARETGMEYGAWLALDLSCLPAVLEVTGPLGEGDVSTSEGALALTAEALRYVQRVSLWRLPALKRAVGDSFASNLTTRELWGLFWTVRGGAAIRGILLDPEGAGEGPADFSRLQKYFGESS